MNTIHELHMHNRRSQAVAPILLAALSMSATACGTDEVDPLDAASASFDRGEIIGAAEVAAIVDLLNDPTTGLALLDDDVGLHVLAAESLLAHRDGHDGVAQSDDDDGFDDLEEVDAVPYVGPLALERLRSWVAVHPRDDRETVEGVELDANEAAAVVWGVNGASVEYLSNVVGLDHRAAEALVERAPYRRVAEMGPVYWVGPAALEALRDHAGVWAAALAIEAANHQAGTFDDVHFDEATARAALELANEASADELVEGGIEPRAADRIVAGRPYASLAEVAISWGVDGTTLRALRDLAAESTGLH